jgi:urocanate hydratase
MSNDLTAFQSSIQHGIPGSLPEYNGRDASIQHAPVRNILYLTKEERRLALQNALRYFPAAMHEKLAPEFAEELKSYGRIYMYRFSLLIKCIAGPLINILPVASSSRHYADDPE